MVVLYRIAKFTSTSIFAMAIWDPAAKFNSHQYFQLVIMIFCMMYLCTIPDLASLCHKTNTHRVLRLEERAMSQSARHRGQQKYQLTLLNAVKPHTKSVISLAVDGEGKVLASGSKDNTVFFLNVQDQYSPIGFIHTPSPVTTMKWSPAKQVMKSILALISYVVGL